MKRVIVIAEIGENHIGNMNIAKLLIKEAAGAGADYVKFQSYRPSTFRTDDPEYEWLKKVSLSDDAHFKLKEYATQCGIDFLSSPFSLERAKFLCDKLKLRAIKIASGVMLRSGILNYVNSSGIGTVFLSTGMATVGEIREALAHLKKVPHVYLLHCVTQYPCKDKEANLLAIKALQKEFPKYVVGYSDHTIGSLSPLIAVSLGAKVIEKHFTFNKKEKKGTDHLLSITPQELKDLVRDIRRTESLLGDMSKRPSISELAIKDFVRNRFI